MNKDADSRYPYTYACDLIRSCAEFGPEGLNMSRAEASNIRRLLARILGMDDEVLAEKLADYYLEHEQEIGKEGAKKTEEWLRKQFGLGVSLPVVKDDSTS